MYAAIELGSDSFRLYAASQAGGALRVEQELGMPIGLSDALDGGCLLSADAMARALACLRRFGATLAQWQPCAVRAVATSALRIARNAELFLPAASQALGHPVEVIAGEEEGRLVWLGVAGTLAPARGQRLVLHVGSGSTALALGDGFEVRQVAAFGVGALRHSLSFFGGGRIDDASFEAAVRSARSKFADDAPAFGARHRDAAYGSSWAIGALAAMLAPDGGGALTPDSLGELRRRFTDGGHAWPDGLQPARAAQLAGALAILIALLDELGIDELQPVQAGAGIGAMWDQHLRQARKDGIALPETG